MYVFAWLAFVGCSAVVWVGPVSVGPSTLGMGLRAYGCGMGLAGLLWFLF